MEFELIHVNFDTMEHKEPEYLAKQVVTRARGETAPRFAFLLLLFASLTTGPGRLAALREGPLRRRRRLQTIRCVPDKFKVFFPSNDSSESLSKC